MLNSAYIVTIFSISCWAGLTVLLVGNNNICSFRYEYEQWVYFCLSGQICLFSYNIVQALPRFLKHCHQDNISSLHILESAVLGIMLIAGASSIIQFLTWDNACASLSSRFFLPVSLWIEWLICVPLMAFVSVFVDELRNLSTADFTVIILLFLTILFGFSSTFQLPFRAKVSMIVLSFLSYGLSGSIVLIWERKKLHLIEVDVEESDGEFRGLQKLRDSIRNKRLAQLLIFVLPPFPIIYILGEVGVLTNTQTFAAFICSGIFSKCLFVSAATGIQSSYLQSQFEAMQRAKQTIGEKLLQSELAAADGRRKYLRFVFHEVRVPLNSITMGISVLQENDDPGVIRDTLTTMDHSASFMADTLNDVLSMQKIEDGKMDLAMKFFRVQGMVARLVSTFEAMLGSKRLVVNLENSVPMSAKGDRFHIEHVIANLLSNAIKFSPEDGVISFLIEYEEEALVDSMSQIGLSRRGVFIFSVVDGGVGMSEDELKGLFQPFYQIRPRETQRGQGSGLGLTIARDTIRLHGGDLTCTSKLGQGSTFSVRLPMEVGHDPDLDAVATDLTRDVSLTRQGTRNSSLPIPIRSTPLANSIVLSAQITGQSFQKSQFSGQIPDSSLPLDLDASGSGLLLQNPLPNPLASVPEANLADPQFLVVDDTESNSKMLRLLLAKRSVESTVAVNGSAAIACVEADPDRFQLVFMDSLMPIMGGIEATRKLRMDLHFENLIIGVTGNALNDDVAAFLAAGADLVLAKPLRLHQLDALLSYCGSHGFVSSSSYKLQMRSPESAADCRIARIHTTQP